MDRFVKKAAVGFAILGGTVAGLGACNLHTDPPPVQHSGKQPGASPAGQQTQMTAKVSGDRPSYETGAYTAVKAKVTNHSTSPLDVNPFNFTVTDQDGTKHTSYVTGDTPEMQAVSVNPGENVVGVVYFKGSFTPKILSITDGLGGEQARAEVSK